MILSKQCLLIFAITTIAASCGKKDKSVCIAGVGGNVTIIVHPKHHGILVKPTNIYIKFNSFDAPGSLNGYDWAAAADTANSFFTTAKLKCGDYYFYAEGYDSSISDDVRGGMPFKIAEGAVGEINLDLPVTE